MKKLTQQVLCLLLALSLLLSGPAQAAELSEAGLSPQALASEDAAEQSAPAELSSQDEESSGTDSAAPAAESSDTDSAAPAAESSDTDSASPAAESSDTDSASPAAEPSDADSTAPAAESSESSGQAPDASEGPAEASGNRAPVDQEAQSQEAQSAQTPDSSAQPEESAQSDQDSALPGAEEDSSLTPEDDTQSAEHLTVRSADQLSDFLASQWNDDHFAEAVVDTRRDRVEVDGQRTSVEDAFGPEADKDAILSSPKAAESYFDDTPFEAEVASDGKVHVTAPWQTCRIVVEADSLPQDYGAEIVVKDAKYHQFVLQFPDEETTEAAYESLSESYPCYVDQVIALEEDESLDTQAADTETWGKAFMHFDTLLSSNLYDAAGTIPVAIIDTGCAKSNEFFDGRAFSSKSKSIIDDGSPYEEGKDTSHGTHVAGIVHSCTPSNVELMILRIYSKSATTTLTTSDTAVKYALENGAKVINYSSAYFGSSTTLDSSLQLAREKGVQVVCSAGNKSQDVSGTYPACSDDAIAVSAINKKGEFAASFNNTSPNWSNLGSSGSGSAYGAGIDFGAPGVGVVSAVENGTASKNGTSMSAPHITAAFACLRLLDPSADWDELYDQLKNLCTDLQKRGDNDTYYPGRDDYYGWGCPDMSRLLVSGHTHVWVEDPAQSVAPTCTTEGFTHYVCSCGAEKDGDYVPAAHSFDENGVCTVCHQLRDTSCGEGVSWVYANYTLTLSGSGTVTSAPWENLYDRQFIRRVVLNGVTGLDDGLFQNYHNLKTVDLGQKLQSIGSKTFYNCSELSQLSLPASLTSLGTQALGRCTSLTGITSASPSFLVRDGILLLNADETRLLLCIGSGCPDTLTLPEGITSIAPGAFDGVTAISTLILPTTLTALEEQALKGCSGLSKVYARSNAASLGENAFDGVTAAVYVSQGCTGWAASDALGGTLTWKSYPGNLANSNVWTMSLNAASWDYTGSGRRPGVKLVHGKTGDADYLMVHNYKLGDEEANHSDCFTFSYTNNVGPAYSTDSAAPPTVTITGKGIYYGSRSMSFSVLLPNPALQSTVPSLNGVNLSWTGHNAAHSYQVLRKEGEGAWVRLRNAVTSGTSYTDTTAVSGVSYRYSVRALNAAGNNASSFSTNGAQLCYLTAPVVLSAAVQEDGSVLVSWNPSNGAVQYQLLRQTSAGAWQVVTATASTSAADTNPVQGGSSLYSVRALASDGSQSAVRSGVSTNYLTTPTIVSGQNEESGIRLHWNGSSGAERYRVSCRKDGGAWQMVQETTDTSLLLTTSDGRTALRDGTYYSFSVRCVSADGSSYASAASPALRMVYLAPPVLRSAACEGSGVRLNWKKAKGAVRFRVFCKQGSGGWKQVKDTSSNSALIKTRDGKNALVTGTSYRFTVRCISADGTAYTSGNNNGKSVRFVKGSSLSSLKNLKKKKLAVQWKRSPKVTGYQVQIATNSAFTKGKKSASRKGEKQLKCTFSGLKKATYWVRVRCYRTVSGKKYWSGWSGVKTIRIKK